MDNEALIAAIDAAEQSSYSSEGDSQLSTDRAYAIDMYLGKNLEPAPEGRSNVTDRSVYETIAWVMPSFCRIFANGDDVVEIVPEGEEDEPGAKQETQYLNHVIQRKNRWFETFITWSKDALLTKNGYCLAYNEERTNTDIDKYQRQTEQGVQLLMSDKDVQVEIDQQYPDPDYVEPPPQPMMDPMTGQPAVGPDGQPMMQPPPPHPMLFDVTVTRTKKEKKTCIEVLPPERCKISYRTPSFRLDRKCPYFEYYDYKTYSDLVADGFKLPKDIPDDWSIDEEEDLARDQYGEESWRSDNNEPDKTMKRYKVRMIWLLHDANEDGIAERLYVVRVGNSILHAEQCSRIPVACLVTDPNGHRHIANSLADITVEIQRTKTAILRQGLDNLYLSNNAQKFITDKINLDDALISRPGGVIRGEAGAVYGQDIAPIVTPFVFDKAMAGLEYMDQVRENRTGTNRYFTGIDQNAMNKTATGVQQLTSMAAQRVEQMARVMACGIEDLFSIVHELILKAGHKKETVKLSNKWTEVDPATWKNRNDFRIAVGYAAGNQDAQVAKLMNTLAVQKEGLAIGICTPKNVYETALELSKANNFSSPDRFWTDPSTQEPQPPPPEPAIEVAKINSQTTLQKTQAEIQAEMEKHQQQLQLDKYKTDTDAQVKLTLAEAQIENQRQIKDKEIAHARESEQFAAQKEFGLKQVDGEQTALLESHKAQLGSESENKMGAKVEQLAEQLNNAIEAMVQALETVRAAKKQVKRGKDGRAEAIDILGADGSVVASQKIVRGKDGQVEGTA